MEIGIVIGDQDNSGDAKLVMAAEIMGFKLETVDYVYSETVNQNGQVTSTGKYHISGFGDRDGKEVFKTLCGIDDICGFWPFGIAVGFDEKDGCKNCKRVLKAHENKKTRRLQMDNQREFQFPGTATARRNDPIGSYDAADQLNENNGKKLHARQDTVLRALKANNGITAKALGHIMAQADIERLTWGFKRMKELELMGFVRRFNCENSDEYDKAEFTCFITSAGEKYITVAVERAANNKSS